MGFAIIAFLSLLYAMYEYSYLRLREDEYRKFGNLRLWVRLLTRGYIANFTLLDFRTTYYNFNERKWMDESDDYLKKDPRMQNPRILEYLNPRILEFLNAETDSNNMNVKNLKQQLWYYTVSLILNFGLIYSWYNLEESYGYFECNSNREVFVLLVVAGAPISFVMSILFFTLRDITLFSSLSLTALQAVCSKMKKDIESVNSNASMNSDHYKALLELMRNFSESDLRNIFRLRGAKFAGKV